jgi:hypothetical protein
MLVTIINEMIAAALKSRAKWLRRGIDRLVGSEWMKKVYAHPLIEGTARKDKTWIIERGPSYIPSRSFANVLMSVVQENSSAITECQKALRAALDSAASTGATVESLRVQLTTAAGQIQKENGDLGTAVASDLARHLDANVTNARTWLGEVGTRVRELQNAGGEELAPLLHTLERLVADGMNTRTGIEELRRRFDAAVTTLLTVPATLVLKEELTALGKRLQGPYTVSDAYTDIQWFIDGISSRYVRQMLEALPAGDLQKTLLTLFDDAKNDVEKLKENIEVWFNNGMDRVNGWYKRRSQLVITILALVMTVAMNVDAILVFKHLQTYPAASEAIAGQAMQFAKNSPSPVPGAPVAADETSSLAGQFDTVQKKLTDLAIPIGWIQQSADTKVNKENKENNGQVLPDLSVGAIGNLAWQHALGWLLTALAATLGAPFWFDMLNRVISIRAAGKPPEEEPKPPKAVSVPVEPGQSQQEADQLRKGESRRR